MATDVVLDRRVERLEDEQGQALVLLARLEERVEATQDGLDDLKERVAKGFAELGAKMDQHSAKSASDHQEAERKLAAVDSRVGAIERQLGAAKTVGTWVAKRLLPIVGAVIVGVASGDTLLEIAKQVAKALGFK